MSYDLIFRSRGRRLSVESFQQYFLERPHYELSQEGGATNAGYLNRATGVEFSFTLEEADVVSFNVNYNRPHFFGLESELEVTAFVNAFDPEMEDPQTDGGSDGPSLGSYSSERYLRGWNTGNRAAYKMIAMTDEKSARWRLPAATLEEFWRWNFNKERTQQYLIDNVEPWFVPAIILLAGASRPWSLVAWSPEVMTLIPKVDVVLVPGNRIIAVAQLEALLAKRGQQPKARRFECDGATWTLGMDAWAIDWTDEPPADIVRALTTKGETPKRGAIPWHQVLTEEDFTA